MSLDESSSSKHALTLLGNNENDLNVLFIEFIPGCLELRQLPSAVGSPSTPQEYNEQCFPTHFSCRYLFAVCSLELEIRRSVFHT